MRSTRLYSILRLWLPVLLWASLIYLLSAIAGLQSGLPIGMDLVLRKFAHATEYAVLAALLLRALSQEGRVLTWRQIIVSLLLAILYAISDEWHQGFVEDRVGSMRDVIIDSVGALVGIDLFRRYYQRKTKQSG